MYKLMVVFGGVVLLSGIAASTSHAASTSPAPAVDINGKTPPGKPTCLEDFIVVHKQVADGKITRITKGRRKAGTRAPIHTHPFGGATCVLKGEMTLYLHGTKTNVTAVEGDCYDMPADVGGKGALRMTGVNEAKDGKEALLIDIFTYPETRDPMRIIEPSFPGCTDPKGG